MADVNLTTEKNTIPKVSVIVPVFNVFLYIEKCVYSILSQSYQNIELILVDDGSNDGSEIICNRLAHEDERIKVFHIENSGVSVARNIGLGLSEGDFIFFVDSDDWIESNIVERMVEESVAYDLDIIACNVYLVTKDNYGNYVNKKRILWPSINKTTILNREEAFYKMFANSAFITNKMVRKTCVSNIRFDESIDFGEDMLFLLKCLNNVNRAAIIPDYGYYYYYKRPGNVVSSTINDKAFRMIESGKLAYQNLTKIELYDLAIARVSVCYSQVLDMIPPPDWKKNKKYIRECHKLANCASLKARRRFYFSRKIPSKTKINYFLFRISPSLWRKIRVLYLNNYNERKR